MAVGIGSLVETPCMPIVCHGPFGPQFSMSSLESLYAETGGL